LGFLLTVLGPLLPDFKRSYYPKKSNTLPALQLDMLHYRGFENNVRLKPNQFQEAGLRSEPV